MAANKVVNPAMFHGLPWELWTNHLGRTSPTEDEAEVIGRQETKPVAGVMKLPKEDMRLFGVCPERDTFCVVTCELCSASVTPQGLLNHIELRHKYGMQPPVLAPPVEKPPAKVVKSIIKNTNNKVKSKKAVSKENSSKSSKESAAGSTGTVLPTPNIPVSVPAETPAAVHQESSGTKGESLQPVVTLTPLSGPLSPTAPVLSKPPTPHISSPPCLPPLLIAAPATKPRRPPRTDRKCVPIREREYDPDKHCGVITGNVGVQGKPCTRSLTCKSHSMSLRRAVTGRSKTFDQLLADHRQAKEALLRQKKNLESQTSAVILTSTSAQPCPQQKEKPKEKGKEYEVPTIIVSSVPAATVVRTVREAVSNVVTTNAAQEVTIRLPVSVSLLNSITNPVISTSPKTPKVSLNISNQRTYLSAIPKAVILKPQQNTDKQTTLVSGPCKLPAQLDIAYINHHPKALGMCTFSSNKIGGLVYTNRRMQIARHGLDGALIDEGYNRNFLTNRGHLGNGLYARELYSNLTVPGNPTATLSNVLNNVTTKALFQRKGNKKIKLQEKVNNNTNKKTVFGIGKVTSFLNTPVSLKSVLPQAYTVSTITPSAGSTSVKNGQFHIPNIISSATLKRANDTNPKTQAKKFKKNNKTPTLSASAQLNTAQIISSLLSGHAKNGLPTSRNNVPLVRVAIANGRLDGDSKAVYSANLMSELSKTAATLADTATTNIAVSPNVRLTGPQKASHVVPQITYLTTTPVTFQQIPVLSPQQKCPGLSSAN